MADTKLEDATDRAYEEGAKSVARKLLRFALIELGEHWRTDEQRRLELSEARAVLRRLCEDHGDNDWPDDLHLADALDKHLGRYLDD